MTTCCHTTRHPSKSPAAAIRRRLASLRSAKASPRQVPRSSSLIPHFYCLLAVLLTALEFDDISAQSARVQFINGSTYEEGETIDVYVDGVRRLDDLKHRSGTPFESYPAGRTLLFQVASGISHGPNRAFYSKTLTLKEDEAYLIVASGDPLKREGEPPFGLFVYEGAHESSSDTPEFVQYVLFNNTPNTTITTAVRGVPQDINPRIDHEYGTFLGYLLAAKMQWDVDFIPAGTDSVIRSIVQDLEVWGNRAGVNLGIGDFTVLSDGTTLRPPRDVAAVQFIHDSALPDADTVDIYVNGSLTVDDLAFGEATPILELPSGLREGTAPDLRVDVTNSSASDNSDPLFSTHTKLIFGRAYVAILAGDPTVGEGGFPLELHWAGHDWDSSVPEDEIQTVFFHGAPGIQGIVMGLEGYARSTTLFYGGFETRVNLPRADTTLFVLDAGDRQLLARFHARLVSMGITDSALVVVTAPVAGGGELQEAGTDKLALLVAPPRGGKLIAFPATVPPPWWQSPWMLLLALAGLAAVAFGASQLRLRQLRARARELERTVEERTQELRAEKEKTEEQARRLAELDEAKNRFFANISHEFRTPLTLILGPVQDFLDGAFGPLSGEARTQHRLMRRNARRLLRLVNQLLDLSRLESGKMTLLPEPGDLVAFLQELVRVFAPMAERRQVSLKLEARVPSLVGKFDFDALEKVFTNLVSNALKFTPEAGSVTITVDVMSHDGSRTAVVSVADTGPGIPEEQLERIFERFHQADSSIRRRHEGSGVGLTLARELAELQGGTLVAESAVRKGSVFTVSLPIVEVEEGTVVEVPVPQHAHLESPLLTAGDEMDTGGDNGLDAKLATLLVVEDNLDVREYLRSHLARRYRLLEAEHGLAGLEIAKLQKPDLILSDVMMPVMDGLEMCRLIKSNDELRHIPVIMLTAKVSEQDAVEGLESGAEDYIAKPFSINELEAKIRNFVTVRRDLRAKFSREVIVKPGDMVITPEEELFLDRALETVNEHLGDSNFSVDWLAEEVGMSRRNLERKVEGTTGQTPADLIRNLRLQRASQLLRAHAGSVSEIAYAVGFSSPQHFATVFKQKYGESPTEHAGRPSSESVRTSDQRSLIDDH